MIRTGNNLPLLLMLVLAAGYACTSLSPLDNSGDFTSLQPIPLLEAVSPPSPDPRVGLKGGLFDAEEAFWNLSLISQMPPPEDFIGSINSDLAFKDHYVIQGNYNGIIIWDISDPASPRLVTEYLCPASQSDVSVYGDLLFVSGEGLEGRLDCGTQGVPEVVSEERLRGIRIFDISDIEEPDYIANVQTCRGSHTHSVLEDPNDRENIYIYVSGSAPVRPEAELPGCISDMPEEDTDSALFRIEVIKVPLANPKQAEIVSSPRIFEDLKAPPRHSGLTPADLAEIEKAKRAGAFVAELDGRPTILPDNMVHFFLTEIAAEGGRHEPTAADSVALRQLLPDIVERMEGDREEVEQRGPNQCHDITLYPEIGLAGGACEGYGFLLDIRDPVNPKRIDAVADSNFAYWHSATFNNDGDKILFTDEWGGGAQPKCRDTDPQEWGANAIFTIEENRMIFKSYYKLPAPQTAEENCVAHNGSLVPVPGRDIKVQSWYQGGISVFDWSDPEKPIEIAYHDRGPVDSTRIQMGGSWSAYWYNGVIVSSEIARGLDIFKLEPNELLTENEIAAANTVTFGHLNPQGQPRYDWPVTYVLARAYLDQLQRERGLPDEAILDARRRLFDAEHASGGEGRQILAGLAEEIESRSEYANGSKKAEKLAGTIRELARAR